MTIEGHEISPWSIRGIQQDIKDTAKTLAAQEGATLGDWLTHLILNEVREKKGDTLAPCSLQAAKLEKELNRVEVRVQKLLKEAASNLEPLIYRVIALEKAHTEEEPPYILTEEVE